MKASTELKKSTKVIVKTYRRHQERKNVYHFNRKMWENHYNLKSHILLEAKERRKRRKRKILQQEKVTTKKL